MRGDSDAQARVRTVIKEKYSLERLIGSGGMASVYKATHRNGHRVAIKMLHAHLSINADLRGRFLREGYVANKVEHQGAVRVLDDDTAEDGAVFLVMDLLEGQTLDGLSEARGGRLPAREVCFLTHQLLGVLAAAHAKGIVHRDIKPENLFLTSEGVVKVLDFGIARLREAGGAASATRTGSMIGTPAFMPPEQALGKTRQIDGQTDLWAVGATMFTLVSGRYVHEAETMEEMMIWAGSRPARPVASVAPDVPVAIAAVIDRALVFDRAERWPDARAMDAALEDAHRATYGVAIADPRRSSQSVPTAGNPRVADGTGGVTDVARGFATTAGVADVTTGAADRPAGVPDDRSRAIMWGALGALVLLVGGGGVVAMRRTTTEAAASLPAAMSNIATAGSAPPPPVAPPQPSVGLPGSELRPVAPPVIPGLTTLLAEGGAGTVFPTRREAVPASPSRPHAVATPVAPPAPVVVTRPPPSATTPKPNCDVPFTIDAQGIRRIRPECK